MNSSVENLRPQLVVKDRLDSWKEIATYLGRGERTVQRWEREQGLPVHRLAHNKQGSVFAYRAELDAWWQSRGTQLDRKESTTQPTPPPAGEIAARRRWPWVLAGVSLLVLVGAILEFWPGDLSTASLHIRPLTTYPGSEICPALSPDGSQVAFAWNGKDGNFDIYVQSLDSGTPLRLTTAPGFDIGPAWSPDGRWIAFVRLGPWGANDELYTVPAIGGAERKIAEVLVAYDMGSMHPPLLAWSPDGKHIAVGSQVVKPGRSGIALFSVDSAQKEALVSPPADQVFDLSPSFSPDGRNLAFTQCRKQSACDLYVAPLDAAGRPGGEPKQLTFGNHHVGSPVWAADGRSILFTSGAPWESRSIWRIPWSGGKKVAREIYSGFNVQGLSVSPKGALVFSREEFDGDIWMADLPRPGAKGQLSKVVASTRLDYAPDLSPDGNRVAFASDRSGNPEIWASNRDGSNPVQLTRSARKRASSPRWSPDGQFLTYFVTGDDTSSICVLRSAGGSPNCISSGKYLDVAPTWSRDGKSIYFVSYRDGQSDLWRIPAGGSALGPEVRITQHGALGPGFESFDGKFIYYVGSEKGVRKVPVNGGEELPVPGLENFGNIALCRTGIYFLSWPAIGRSASLIFLPNGGTTPSVVATVPEPYGAISSSEDGRTVLFTEVMRRESDLMLVDNFR